MKTAPHSTSINATKILVSAALAGVLLLSPTTFSALAGQWTWQELYKWENYIDAADELKSQLDKGKNTVVNNYYYADCLMRLNRQQEALPYYMNVYKMDRAGRFGKYAEKVLRRYNKLSTKNVTEGMSSSARAAELGVKTPSSTQNQNSTQNSTSQAKISREAQIETLLRDMRRKLPKLDRIEPIRPSLTEISAWPISNQAGYYPAASSRVSDAEERLDSGKELLSQATAKISGSGSSFRNYGESKEDTQARIDATNDAIDRALEPFNQHVAELTSQLNEARAILQLCINARNTLHLTPIYGFPYYP